MVETFDSQQTVSAENLIPCDHMYVRESDFKTKGITEEQDLTLQPIVAKKENIYSINICCEIEKRKRERVKEGWETSLEFKQAFCLHKTKHSYLYYFFVCFSQSFSSGPFFLDGMLDFPGNFSSFLFPLLRKNLDNSLHIPLCKLLDCLSLRGIQIKERQTGVQEV